MASNVQSTLESIANGSLIGSFGLFALLAIALRRKWQWLAKRVLALIAVAVAAYITLPRITAIPLIALLLK